MARYTGPKWRINRREGANVLGAGEKWRRRTNPPGDTTRAPRLSQYGVLFREKQKVKRMYGMQERQFRRFFAMARKSTGNTGTRFLQLLELRLDNVIFRAGHALTRAQARQMVTHGHVMLNGKPHNVPSTVLGAGDEFAFTTKATSGNMLTDLTIQLENNPTPAWIERYSTGGKVTAEPSRDLLDQSIKERLIIELYSK